MAEPAKLPPGTELTPLTDALATIDRVEPVAPEERDLSAAHGYTLAADAGTAPALRLTGARLRRIDISLLASLGITRACVRTPRVLVLRAARAADAACTLIENAIEAEGGIAMSKNEPLETPRQLENMDAAIAIGSDTDARDEAGVRMLANLGRVAFDGVGLIPGGGIAFGNAGSRPILLLPGRLEAALAAWLTLGRRLLARLSFRLIEEQPFLLELARPVTSRRGFAEIVPVRRRAAQVEPLTGGDWTPQTIARADGWILLPAESEGLAAGAKVAVRPWP